MRTDAARSPRGFPRAFWVANTTELFERAAYYSMASFVVIYLGRLGLGRYWPSLLSSTVLWALLYFLPILSGTIADQIGFRRSLLVAFVLLTAGYFAMGYPVWFGGQRLAPIPGKDLTAGWGVGLPVVLGILLIGAGGSVIKPCISGTVQKTHSGRATLAFAIFYMVINIGSIVGRVVAYWVRTSRSDLSAIYLVAMGCSVAAFFIVLLTFREPDRPEGARAAPARTVGRILLDMVLVLRNPRFAIFLTILSGFWFLYNQVYNVLPLYAGKIVEANPAMDLYTTANPVTIVCFQLLVTKLFGKLKAVRSIVVGTVIIGLAMVINLVPLFAGGGLRAPSVFGLPAGSVFVILTVALIAVGELFTAARTFEWIGAMAPKGQEGLFLGYANLPTAIGALISGWIGAYIFNEIMCDGASTRPDGLLDVRPGAVATGWLLLMGIGFASAAGMWLYNLWLERRPDASAA
ncbi:MAG: MFS transporter [Acidobacteriia bacterium]|nr:MFS transporter [Terriglobia bacterium]